ncbi:MAG: ABC transporter substrate-binding protein [Thermoleophilia bacterium]|nr:ABC transporter substrate-binding protein [Thermoleophilia bacterium]
MTIDDRGSPRRIVRAEGFEAWRFTRRDLLKGAAAIGGAAAFGVPILAGCGEDSETATPSPAAESPVKGGHIRSGVSGGSAKDSLDAHTAYLTVPQIGMQWQLYDSLLGFDPDHKMIYLLAESYEPSADATEHVVRLKPDLVFHNGKTVTADDVVASYLRILDPKTGAAGVDLLSDLSPSGIKKLDDLTVQFTLDRPNAIFWESLAFFCNAIVPEGYDPKVDTGLIGTGPWVIDSYYPGDKAHFTANPDYWGEGPYADELTMTQFADSTARLNALLDGSVDHIELVEAAQTEVIKGNADLTLLEAKSGGWKPFTMRIDKKPFDDVRVRQAMRLIADRQQMIDQALAGYAWLGNDMYAPYDPGYPSDLPQRTQDLEQAKSLLKQAGYEGLTVELTTSSAVGSGMVEAAQVFAEQAKGAGVTIDVNNVDAGIFYGDDYLQWDFAQDYWATRNYLAQTKLCTTPDAPYNETHWQDDEWQALIDEAFLTSDEAKRNELVRAAETIEYERGGFIVWQHNILLDAYNNRLGGVIPDTWGQSACKNRYNLMYFRS